MTEEERAHLQTDEKLDGMIRHLDEVYSRAEKDLRDKWEEFLLRSSERGNELRDAMLSAKTREEKRRAKSEYQKFLQNATLRDKRFKVMAENLAEQYSHINETALAYINGELPEVYALNFNAAGGDISAKVGGYSFQIVSAGTVRELATRDTSLLPYCRLDPAKDTPWNVRKMNGEVLQGILLGESIPDIAGRLKNVTNMNRDSAVRNARTMVTAAENKGRLDEYRAAEDSGVILEREWVAALDKKTRDLHVQLDRQRRAVGEPFQIGGYTIMYPGDPSAAPEMVYNCRCTTIARIKGFRKISGGSLKSGAQGGIINRKASPQLPKEKFTEYLLNPAKDPGKAKGFETALGYTVGDADAMSENISSHYDPDSFEFVRYNGYGNQYQQIMTLEGPNGKTADIITAWIVKDGEDFPRLVTAHLHKKKQQEEQND